MKYIFLIGLLCICSSTNASPILEESRAMLEAMNAKEQYKVVALEAQAQLGIPASELNRFSERIFEEMARIYSEVYTLEELKGIRVFYESKAGKAFISKKSQLTEKYMAVVNKLATEYIAE